MIVEHIEAKQHVETISQFLYGHFSRQLPLDHKKKVEQECSRLNARHARYADTYDGVFAEFFKVDFSFGALSGNIGTVKKRSSPRINTTPLLQSQIEQNKVTKACRNLSRWRKTNTLNSESFNRATTLVLNNKT